MNNFQMDKRTNSLGNIMWSVMKTNIPSSKKAIFLIKSCWVQVEFSEENSTESIDIEHAWPFFFILHKTQILHWVALSGTWHNADNC